MAVGAASSVAATSRRLAAPSVATMRTSTGASGMRWTAMLVAAGRPRSGPETKGSEEFPPLPSEVSAVVSPGSVSAAVSPGSVSAAVSSGLVSADVSPLPDPSLSAPVSAAVVSAGSESFAASSTAEPSAIPVSRVAVAFEPPARSDASLQPTAPITNNETIHAFILPPHLTLNLVFAGSRPFLHVPSNPPTKAIAVSRQPD